MTSRRANSRRDRHGRGTRTGTRPWHGATRFEHHVHEAITSLEPEWGTTLADLRVLIADIPDLDHLDDEIMPLGSTAGSVITLFRHPITIRCNSDEELGALILDVLIEELAETLGLDPEEVDERYGDSG